MRQTAVNRFHLFRCVKATKAGTAAEVLQTTDFPIHGLKLKEDEVLVRMSFAGVNFIDTYYRSGLYTKATNDRRPTPFPYIVGEEGSGAVVQCGSPSVKERWINKRVAFIANEMGSYSSFTVVKEKDLFEIPKEIDDKTAAAVMLQGTTAHYLCHDTYPVGAKDTVLIHAAAGGTGLLLGQMAKARGAKTVIGICGGAEKAAAAKAIGKCDDVIDYLATPEWEKEVLKIASGKGAVAVSSSKCSVVFDGVGKSTFEGSLNCLKPRGMMVSFGNASGAVDPIAPLVLNQKGSLFLTRPKLHDYMLDREEAQRRVAEVFKMVADAKVAVTIHSAHKLEKAKVAHELLEGKKTIGKLIINCQE